MDFEKVLEVSSNVANRKDKFLEDKLLKRNMKKYLNEGRRSSLDIDQEEEAYKNLYPEPADPTHPEAYSASEFDIPFQGEMVSGENGRITKGAEGLKLCLSVVTNSGNFDWRRKRGFLESSWDAIKSEPKLKSRVTDTIQSAHEVQTIITKHENGDKITEAQKDKVVDWAENFGELLTTGAQLQIDSDSQGAYGGRGHRVRLNNMIPCKFNDGTSEFKGLIVVLDPNKNSGSIRWISDKEGMEDSRTSIARQAWKDAAFEAKLGERLENGRIRFMPEEYTVEESDASKMRSIGLTFDDSKEAKEEVKNAYMKAFDYLGSMNQIDKRSIGKPQEKIESDLLGWNPVMASFRFWKDINV